MRKLVLLFFVLCVILIYPVKASNNDSYECSYYPMDELHILEIYSNNSFKLSPGKVYAPFTGVVKRSANNSIWFESLNPVRLTNDKFMYVTMMLQTNSALVIPENKVIIQGNLMLESESDIHIEMASGVYVSSNWTFSNNVWTQGKGLSPSVVFWINPLIKAVDNKGLVFKSFEGHDPYTLGVYETTRFLNNKNVLINPSFDVKYYLTFRGTELILDKDINDTDTSRCVLYEQGDGLYKISIDDKFLIVDKDKVSITYGEGSLFKIRKHIRGYIISYINNENLVLTYESIEDGFSVNISEYRGTTNQLWYFNRIVYPAFSSILLNTKPYKTEFSNLEEITTDGLTLKEIYNDGTYLVISDGFDLIEGDNRITVSYKKKTVFFPITKVKIEDELIIKNKPDKLIYLIGEKIDTKGLEVAIRYADGSIELVEDYYFKLYNLNTEGMNQITVLYNGRAASFDVLVLKDTINNIEIKSLPKTEYFIYDKLDTRGIKLTLEYEDGSSNEIDKDFNCYPVVFDSIGKHVITVNYAGVTTSFEVNVKPIEVVDIQVKSLPHRLVYGLGEELVIDGLSIAVRLNNGCIISKTQGFNVGSFDSKTPGKKTVEVSYAGKTASFEVTVIGSKINRIEVCNYPSNIDLYGLSLNLIYDNGDIVNVTSGFDIINEFENEGYNDVIIKYLNYTARYKVYVENREITKISVMNYPQRLHYRMFEELNTTGLTIKVYFNDGSIEEISKGYSVFYDFTKDSKVTVLYKGFETEFDVKIVYSEPDQLVVNYKRYTAYLDRSFDKEQLEVLACYNDGTIYHLDDYDIEYNPIQEGIYPVKISFGALTNSFDVVAISNRIIRIYVVSYPEDKQFGPGDVIDDSEIVLKAVYHDGSEEYIYGGFECIYDFSKDSRVVVKYMDYVTTFKVNLRNGSSVNGGFSEPKIMFLIVVLLVVVLFIIYMFVKRLIKKRIENSIELS